MLIRDLFLRLMFQVLYCKLEKSAAIIWIGWGHCLLCYLIAGQFFKPVRKIKIHFQMIKMMLSPAQTRMKAVDDDECG